MVCVKQKTNLEKESIAVKTQYIRRNGKTKVMKPEPGVNVTN